MLAMDIRSVPVSWCMPPIFFRFLRPGGKNGSFSSEDLHRTDHFIFRGIFALPENAERNRIYVPHVLLLPPPPLLFGFD